MGSFRNAYDRRLAFLTVHPINVIELKSENIFSVSTRNALAIELHEKRHPLFPILLRAFRPLGSLVF